MTQVVSYCIHTMKRMKSFFNDINKVEKEIVVLSRYIAEANTHLATVHDVQRQLANMRPESSLSLQHMAKMTKSHSPITTILCTHLSTKPSTSVNLVLPDEERLLYCRNTKYKRKKGLLSSLETMVMVTDIYDSTKQSLVNKRNKSGLIEVNPQQEISAATASIDSLDAEIDHEFGNVLHKIRERSKLQPYCVMPGQNAGIAVVTSDITRRAINARVNMEMNLAVMVQQLVDAANQKLYYVHMNQQSNMWIIRFSNATYRHHLIIDSLCQALSPCRIWY